MKLPYYVMDVMTPFITSLLVVGTRRIIVSMDLRVYLQLKWLV
jgi:hypothetical protein